MKKIGLNKEMKKISLVQASILLLIITLVFTIHLINNSHNLIERTRTLNKQRLITFESPCTETECSITCEPDNDNVIECLSSEDCDDGNPCTQDLCVLSEENSIEQEVQPYNVNGNCYAITILPTDNDLGYACISYGGSCVFDDADKNKEKTCLTTGTIIDGEKKPYCICPSGYEVETNDCEYIDKNKIGVFSCLDKSDGCSSFTLDSYTFKDSCNKGNVAEGTCICKKTNPEHCSGTKCEHLPVTSYTSCTTNNGLQGYCLYDKCVRTEVISLPIKWSFMIKGRVVVE